MISKATQTDGSNGRPFKKFFCDRDEVFLIPPNAFKLWMFHYRLEGQERASWPSREFLCRKLGVSEKTLTIARRWLVEHGWLQRIGQRNSESGEFAIPVFKVTRGTVESKLPHGREKLPHGRTKSSQSRKVSYPPSKKVSAVAESKLPPEVDVKREVDTREVEGASRENRKPDFLSFPSERKIKIKPERPIYSPYLDDEETELQDDSPSLDEIELDLLEGTLQREDLTDEELQALEQREHERNERQKKSDEEMRVKFPRVYQDMMRQRAEFEATITWASEKNSDGH